LPVLRYAILSAGLASAIAIAAAPRLGELAGRPARRRALASTVAGAAAVAALAGPFAYALDTVATSHSGALPTAGPAVAASFGGGGPGGPGGTGGPGGSGRPASSGRPGSLGRSGNPGSAGPSGLGKPGGSAGAVPSGLGGSANGRPGPGTGGTGTGGTGAGGAGTGGTGAGGRLGAGGPGGLNGSTTVSVALTKLLEQHAAQYTWAAATVGSESAAPLQLATGDPIMSIGGFNGTDPAPTLAQFERYVAEHKIHYFVGANSDSFGGGSGDAAAITKWVASHFRSQTVDGETVYNLTDPVSSS